MNTKCLKIPVLMVVFFVAVMAGFCAVAQEVPEINDEGHDGAVERLPTYPDGMEGFKMDLTLNTRYPEKALKKGIAGRVFCFFHCNRRGECSQY